MPVGDIRPVKSELRSRFKQWRRDLPADQKASMDEQIARKVQSLWQYKRENLLLTYVSTPIEVDTRAIIRRALDDGKTVAVPRCVPGTRLMEFYRIDSLEELSPGTFGVDEPTPDPARLVTNFEKGLCLVPALCYDWKGFRLGYGGGYYDRFLAAFGGAMVGVCYSGCIRRSLPHGRYDRPVDLLVTERYLRRTEKTR
ncbi:MAG: 5-formyltetrahydrofolate cyclo-ligase [Acutalibacteraceae bacterium]|jgi:5-formyltetrahydrofolate cyclo-ligase